MAQVCAVRNQWMDSIRGLVQERWPRVVFYRRGTNYARIVIARKDIPDISGKLLFHRDVSTVIAIMTLQNSDDKFTCEGEEE